jgi:membrane protease YdiL (CAAX protease family)
MALAVAPAVAEECFFRGLLLSRLTARVGQWPAILASAAAFGLFHVDPVQGSVAFAAGIFLAWVADRFGGIRLTISAHGLNNAAFVLFAWLAPPHGSFSRTASVALLMGGSAAFVASVFALRSARAIRRQAMGTLDA